ncbi:potassium channel family protein [Catalinimonas niigatensis]|uniref:potassium channel family protein n=1 Tax=Catalinimonas niigatensis TaxID=1397264 RepID=UPI002666CB43|nr:potassium channel family protein [Catalinimonas niigatensis]WPP50160.1 potassium channel family protein [Catalinimonas niigatensis]
MISIILAALGVFIVGFCLYDFALTTFLASGQGPLTSTINHLVYSLYFRLAKKQGRHPLMEYVGMGIIFSILITWVLLLWGGLLLIFAAFPDSVLNGQTKAVTDVAEKLYFVGFSLSTLGVGDFVPGDDMWRIVTAFCAFLGLITITISITYLVPVLSNAVQKRTLAMQISAFGESPEQIVINSYNGEDFSDATSQLSNLASMIFTYTQNQLTYPILHHMHATKPSDNIVLQFTTLDEALSIFMLHVPEPLRPQRMALQLARRAITTYLETVTYMGYTEEAPPLPDLSLIEKETGVKLWNTEERETKALYKALSKRRRLIYSNIMSDGWQWKDIQNKKYVNQLDAEPATRPLSR